MGILLGISFWFVSLYSIVVVYKCGRASKLLEKHPVSPPSASAVLAMRNKNSKGDVDTSSSVGVDDDEDNRETVTSV